MITEDETLTPQAAANFLGVSRQHFVDLLEEDEIDFHYVGTHRRVYFRDLKEYADKRDDKRKEILDELFDKVTEAENMTQAIRVMIADYKILLDANVLANYAVCNLYLRLAEKPRLFLPKWTPYIPEEV